MGFRAVNPRACARAVATHRELWGEPDLVVRAPGRVNLIGDHTDYNGGFCLPMALPFDTVVATSRFDSPNIEVVSEGFGAAIIDPTDTQQPISDWARHLAGVAWLMHEGGTPVGSWRATIASDIPAGASLSSSAAIEVAAIRTVLEMNDLSWSPIDIARLGQRIENEIVGLPSGIMDQFIVAGAIEGHAGLLDCRALTLTPIPLPDGARVAVIDTGTRRRLSEAAYADRRATCERVAEVLGVEALSDATLTAVSGLPDSLDLERRRARHVVTENERTLIAAEAMSDGDIVRVGEVMNASHASLRDDFDVSSPALDQIVAIASNAPGCLGARMTGGGFAGCAVSLVRSQATDDFAAAVTSGYRHDDHVARVWICGANAGADRIAPTDW